MFHPSTARPRAPLHRPSTRLVAAVLAALGTAGCERSLRTPPPADTGPELEALRLSEGLLPAVLVEGREEPIWRLRERLEHHRVPGVSVAVIDGGELRFAKAWGLAEAGTEDPITPATLLQASSISKALTATAALRLVEAGELRLDADLRPVFAGWSLDSWPPPPSTEAPITLRQLLAHTSGASLQVFGGYGAAEPLPGLDEILTGSPPADHPPVAFPRPPGRHWLYSGGAYQVVQKLLEETAGRPFEEWVSAEIFSPLEMAASRFTAPGDPALAATGHDAEGRPLPGRFRLFPELAAAGLWSNPTELVSWLTDLQKALAGKPARRLRRQTVREMVADQVPHGDGDASPTEWGLGVLLGGSGQARWLAHPGGNPGYPSLALAFLSSGHGAVIMTNGDGGHALVREIVTGLARIYDWPHFQPRTRTSAPLSAEERTALVGTYTFPALDGQMLEIAEAESREAAADGAPSSGLQARFLGASSLLYAESAGALFDLEQGWELDVRTRGDDGLASRLEVRLFPGYRFRAVRSADG